MQKLTTRGNKMNPDVFADTRDNHPDWIRIEDGTVRPQLSKGIHPQAVTATPEEKQLWFEHMWTAFYALSEGAD